MTAKNMNLFELIEAMPREAAIPAYRSLANSTLARGIGAIRSHLREQAQLERSDENEANALDQRAETDDLAAGTPEEVAKTLGFGQKVNYLLLARVYHSMHAYAVTCLKTLSDSKWDDPMSIDLMLKFMTERASTLDEKLVEVLAAAARTTPEAIRKMHELQDRQDREKLLQAVPAITTIWNGFESEGYSDSCEELDVLAQHAIGVKLASALVKAKDNVLNRVMRTRSISELSQIPLIDAAIKDVHRWVDIFENTHKDELAEAMEAGRNVPTLEDLA